MSSVENLCSAEFLFRRKQTEHAKIQGMTLMIDRNCRPKTTKWQKIRIKCIVSRQFVIEDVKNTLGFFFPNKKKIISPSTTIA